MGKRYDVIVAGGGPVGVGLAVSLGLRGLTVAVVERRIDLHNIPKGQNLTQRTLEHFWFWGIADELRAARVMPPEIPANGIIAYESLSTPWWYAPPLREIVNQYYFQANDRMPQYCLEAVLRRKMAATPGIDPHFGWSVKSVDQDADGVRVAIEQDSSNKAEVLEGSYVVGCDGSHSLVRDRLGIGRGGEDYDQLMVLAVIRSRDLSDKLAERFPLKSTYRVMNKKLKGYWQFFGRVDADEAWFFHSPVPADTTRANFDFQGLLQQVAGFPFECTFDYVGFWDLRIAVADRYQKERVFIAGDAAHSHPPYGGYGLNNGLEDAVNLAWKIAAVLEGWGGARLLETYTEERKPVFEETGRDYIAGRIELDREFFETYDPEWDLAAFEKAWHEDHASLAGPRVLNYEPNYAGSSIVAGPPGARCSAHGRHMFKARPGHHLPSRLLSDGRNVFEALGRGFTLLAFDAPQSAIAGFELAAASAGIPFDVVRDGFDGGREAYEARLILVRPDQFIVWCGDDAPSDWPALIAKVTGH